jgi:hypothetical protein
MPEFKTAQFLNTAQGQAQKAAFLKAEAAQGWYVLSETIIPGKFQGGQACCLFMICAPFAFLAGHDPAIIQVTLQRTGDPGQALTGNVIQLPTVSYDRAKWDALVQYDKEIAAAADQVRPLGSRWVAELAAGYMSLNDKTYLPNITAKIEEKAREQQREDARRAAIEEERRRAQQAAAEEQRRQQQLALDAEVQARSDAPWRYLFWGSPTKKAVTSIASIVILIIAASFLMNMQNDSAPAQAPVIVQKDAPSGTQVPSTSRSSGAQPSMLKEGVKPSYDCSNVQNQVLILICSTPSLAQADRRLAIAFIKAKAVSQDPEKLKMDEREWITTRNNSEPDVATLTALYNSRITYLNALVYQARTSPSMAPSTAEDH